MTAPKPSSKFKWDLLIASFFILVGSTGCYAFFHYHDSFGGFGSGISLGELKSQETVGVRYRTGSSLIWQDVAKTQAVSVGDAVFTGPGASTQVRFTNHVETGIGPDSLVVFNAPSEEMRARFPESLAVLSVQKGSVKLNVTAEGEPILIESGGKVFSMPTKTGSVDLKVNSETGKLEANTESGEALALKEEPITPKTIPLEVPKVAKVLPPLPVVAEVTPEAKTEVAPVVPAQTEIALRAPATSTQPHPAADVTWGREPASEAPVQASIPPLDSQIFIPKVSYGVNFISFSQNGAFGRGSGSAVSVSFLKAGLEFLSGDWGANAEFSRYSLDFQVNSSSSMSTTSKSFQDILMEGSYKNVSLGIHAKSAPVLAILTTSDVRFLDLTTMSVIAGYRLSGESLTESDKIIQTSLDLRAELPVSGSSTAVDGIVNMKRVSGFGARVTGRVAKSLNRAKSDSPVRFFIGLEGGASFNRTQFDATMLNLDGTSTRDLQEYQALLQLRMEF